MNSKNPVVVMSYRNMQLIIRVALLIGLVAGVVLVGVPWLLLVLL